MSYAAISRFNADRIASSEEGRPEALKKKFLHARETAQRVVVTTAQHLKGLLDSVSLKKSQ